MAEKNIMKVATTQRKLRELITPDGVPLNLELATYGERVSAVLIDLTIMGLTFGAILLASFLLFSTATWEILLIIILLTFFVIRSFYFIYFEINWHGVTPGKKALGLKVIDRKGGVLEPESIFARNLMREVELYLPITLVFVQADIGLERLYLILNFLWMGIFILMPLFNKDRLRAGDMIGDTLVIRSPKVSLLSDPVKRTTSVFEKENHPDLEVNYSFTTRQLNVYGIFELQTLEKILRSKGQDSDEIMLTVANQIAKKINWQNGPFEHNCERFLSDFYIAMRKHHEAQLLFGKRKKDKFDGPANPDPEPDEKQPQGSQVPPTTKPYKSRRRRRR